MTSQLHELKFVKCKYDCPHFQGGVMMFMEGGGGGGGDLDLAFSMRLQ